MHASNHALRPRPLTISMAPHAESLVTPPSSPPLNTTTQQTQDPFTGFSTTALSTPPFAAPENRSHLRYTPEDEVHDLLCIGFGPASLAIAVALHDAIDGSDPSLQIPSLQHGKQPKVAFLEKQDRFRWHAGMLLSGARMQITFMKDMATMRNPRSEFTFINYLFRRERLVEFANLGTFLPQRVEYEDYMKWCAAWFDDVVSYGQEVVEIIPERTSSSGKIDIWTVVSRNLATGDLEKRRAKHVVVAAGGRPNLPAPFPQSHPRVVHSSQFGQVSGKILPDFQKEYRIAVVGNGQSAAEIFDFLHTHYPNAKTRLLIKGSALRPSDDSPFVNEIFNPSRVDPTFNRDPQLRSITLAEDKGTNYGVVRLNLLEHIYETLYIQRIKYGNSPSAEAQWPHRILPHRRVTNVTDSPVVKGGVRLVVQDKSPLFLPNAPGETEREEVFDVDAVFVATGYQRDLHEWLLKDARALMPGGEVESKKWEVGRDYRMRFKEGEISEDAGVWLQGCCESTHGLSDTLLSILASRGGEMVQNIFGKSGLQVEATGYGKLEQKTRNY